MKFFLIEDGHYMVFINSYFNAIDLKNKKSLEKVLIKIIKQLTTIYSVCIFGLFEVNIFVNEKIGMFINFEKITSLISSNSIDLKINIMYGCDFYFKTSHYECLSDLDEIYFSENYYYIDAKKLSDLNKYIEFGDIIYDVNLNVEKDFVRIK